MKDFLILHIVGNEGTSGKALMKSIVYFQAWRIGITFFILGICLNFVSFGYAAQSLLAALWDLSNLCRTLHSPTLC
ncbi:hypothetical protein ACS0TY_034867 [Phlomoides rotata]